MPEEIELEVFVHGSMCVSWSGRCLLSASIIGRDANRGMCAQPCRWNYKLYSGNNVKNENKNVNNENNKNSGTLQKGAAFENGRFYEIEEESRPGQRYPVEEDELGTFIMSSKDLCMIEHIPELIEAGIDSFKIEGRMKTALYVATVARTYRLAIDEFLQDPELYKSRIPFYKSEIQKCTYRQYTTGFFFGKPDENTQIYDSNTYVKEYTYLGIVGECNDKGLYHIEQRNKFSVGETIEVMRPDGTNMEVTVKAIYNEDGEAMESAPHPKQQLYIDLGVPLCQYDILRRKED